MQFKILVDNYIPFNNLKNIYNLNITDEQIVEILHQIYSFLNKDFNRFIINFAVDKSKINYSKVFATPINKDQLNTLSNAVLNAAASVYFICYETGMFRQNDSYDINKIEIFPELITKNFSNLNIVVQNK